MTKGGTPIPVDFLPFIFEPLVRGSEAASSGEGRSKTSLGLGLFIVREIAQGHGGGLSVESNESATTFTIKLPITPATMP